MEIREAIQKVSGFRYMLEQLPVCSVLGKRALYELEWLIPVEAVEREMERVQCAYDLWKEGKEQLTFDALERKLMQLRDIRGTVMRLREGYVLDDLELFEVKNFALLAEEIRKIIIGWNWISLPDLADVVNWLDPEGSGVPHFYVYDAYSGELAELRKEIRERKRQQANEEETDRLYFRSVALEDKIREDLSEKLRRYGQSFQMALEQMALLDLTVAKARQAACLGLCRPSLHGKGTNRCCYADLFHPQLRAVLEEEGKEFQSVSISVREGVTVITGANMAGKTVVLKMVALAQCLVQFGFWVPAVQAEISLVEEIFFSIGDEQDDLQGLSSFAAEMYRIQQMIEELKAGKKLLVLIDELARTTNPEEGRAILNGMLELLGEEKVIALVTTHYSGIVVPCRRLRVKGLREEAIQDKLAIENIGEYMDYTLVEDEGQETPHEAFRIARMLGVDTRLLEKAERFFDL